MKLEKAKQYLKIKGYTLLERELGENQEQDIYDIQDYILHHAKYNGIYQMQLLMDWLSFDNPDANSFMNWIRTNYQPNIDFEEICEKAVMIANEYIEQNQNIPTQETFYNTNEMYEGYNDYAEKEALNGNISPRDKQKIEKGYNPYWVKKTTNIGTKKLPLKQSSSPSEMAMRSVNTNNGKITKPYTETDLKNNNKLNKINNLKLADNIASYIECETTTFSNENAAMIQTDKYIFKINNTAPRYFIVRINNNSVMDRLSTSVRKISEIIKFINENLD